MSKHTPGPWWFRFYAGDDDLIAFMREQGQDPMRMLTNDGQVAILAGEDGAHTRIALADPQERPKRGQGHAAECAQRDANAALIAAAPELLAAGKHILALLDHPERSVTALDADKLRDAIAKAGA